MLPWSSQESIEGTGEVSQTWRNRICSCEVPIQAQYIGLVIGTRGTNLRRLESMKDVMRVYVDSKRSVVIINACTDAALNSVRNDISSHILKSQRRPVERYSYPRQSTEYQIQNESTATVENYRFYYNLAESI